MSSKLYRCRPLYEGPFCPWFLVEDSPWLRRVRGSGMWEVVEPESEAD